MQVLVTEMEAVDGTSNRNDDCSYTLLVIIFTLSACVPEIDANCCSYLLNCYFAMSAAGPSACLTLDLLHHLLFPLAEDVGSLSCSSPPTAAVTNANNRSHRSAFSAVCARGVCLPIPLPLSVLSSFVASVVVVRLHRRA